MVSLVCGFIQVASIASLLDSHVAPSDNDMYLENYTSDDACCSTFAATFLYKESHYIELMI
jgi:hypothetical protein